MSVINKMLRDLDKRQQQPGSAPAGTAAAQMPSRGIGLWWLAITLVLLLLAVVLGFRWWLSSDKPVLQQSSAAQSSTTLAEAHTEAAQQPAADTSTATVTPPYGVTPAPSAEQPQSGQPHQAQQSQPAPANQRPTEPAVMETPPSAVNPAATAVAGEPELTQPLSPATSQQPLPEPQAAASTTAAAQQQMSVEPVQLSSNELAEKKYQAGLDSLQKERPDSAELMFKDALSLNPEHIQARSRLAALWYGRGNGGEALQVLAQGLALLPQQPDWRLLQARIQRALSDDTAALASLQQVSVGVAKMPDVFILRATLAQQLGEYQQALQDYQRLHQWQPDDARWLLGAGVASEYLEQYDNALSYYRRGLAARELSQSLQQFMQQRVQQLEEQGE